jgi:small subunit ribosomal protein S1
VRVKILEIDSERRRLSLSIKRVEGQVLPVRPIVPPTESDATDLLDDVPELGLSEEVFASDGAESHAEPLIDDDEPSTAATESTPDVDGPAAASEHEAADHPL